MAGLRSTRRTLTGRVRPPVLMPRAMRFLWTTNAVALRTVGLKNQAGSAGLHAATSVTVTASLPVVSFRESFKLLLVKSVANTAHGNQCLCLFFQLLQDRRQWICLSFSMKTLCSYSSGNNRMNLYLNVKRQTWHA